jgi:hypothetical protein
MKCNMFSSGTKNHIDWFTIAGERADRLRGGTEAKAGGGRRNWKENQACRVHVVRKKDDGDQRESEGMTGKTVCLLGIA